MMFQFFFFPSEPWTQPLIYIAISFKKNRCKAHKLASKADAILLSN